MNFYDTIAGRRFFDHQLPGLMNALQKIADGLSRPQPVIQISAEDSETFLQNLFYGQFEPDFWRKSQQSNKYNHAIVEHQVKMQETLSSDLYELAEKYRELLEDRHSFETAKSFESGYTTAVKMMAAGLATSFGGQVEEEGCQDE